MTSNLLSDNTEQSQHFISENDFGGFRVVICSTYTDKSGVNLPYGVAVKLDSDASFHPPKNYFAAVDMFLTFLSENYRHDIGVYIDSEYMIHLNFRNEEDVAEFIMKLG